MKNSKITIIALMAFIMVSYLKAQDVSVDFDGRNISLNQSFLEKTKGENTENNFPLPVVKLLPQKVNLPTKAEVNNSIMKTINYCKKNNADGEVINNLKKLLAYGTDKEKQAFLASDKYFFPNRFYTMKEVNMEDMFLLSRGYQQNCWEDNCRMEQVCGRKKSCSRVCEIVGLTCASAGATIVQSYTGVGTPSASLVGGALGAGCKWACEDWVCSEIEDCQEVEKCDSHCETVYVNDDADQVDPNTGQVTYQ